MHLLVSTHMFLQHPNIILCEDFHAARPGESELVLTSSRGDRTCTPKNIIAMTTLNWFPKGKRKISLKTVSQRISVPVNPVPLFDHYRSGHKYHEYISLRRVL